MCERKGSLLCSILLLSTPNEQGAEYSESMLHYNKMLDNTSGMSVFPGLHPGYVQVV